MFIHMEELAPFLDIWKENSTIELDNLSSMSDFTSVDTMVPVGFISEVGNNSSREI